MSKNDGMDQMGSVSDTVVQVAKKQQPERSRVGSITPARLLWVVVELLVAAVGLLILVVHIAWWVIEKKFL